MPLDTHSKQVLNSLNPYVKNREGYNKGLAYLDKGVLSLPFGINLSEHNKSLLGDLPSPVKEYNTFKDWVKTIKKGDFTGSKEYLSTLVNALNRSKINHFTKTNPNFLRTFNNLRPELAGRLVYSAEYNPNLFGEHSKKALGALERYYKYLESVPKDSFKDKAFLKNRDFTLKVLKARLGRGLFGNSFKEGQRGNYINSYNNFKSMYPNIPIPAYNTLMDPKTKKYRSLYDVFGEAITRYFNRTRQ